MVVRYGHPAHGEVKWPESVRLKNAAKPVPVTLADLGIQLNSNADDDFVKFPQQFYVDPSHDRHDRYLVILPSSRRLPRAPRFGNMATSMDVVDDRAKYCTFATGLNITFTCSILIFVLPYSTSQIVPITQYLRL
jgi:hypothetical protein